MTSPPAVFSLLAWMAMTLSARLPGIPVTDVPSIPDAFLLPALSVSTVLVHAGCGSVGSNEEANSGAGSAAGAVGACAMAGNGTATSNPTVAPTATARARRDLILCLLWPTVPLR